MSNNTAAIALGPAAIIAANNARQESLRQGRLSRIGSDELIMRTQFSKDKVMKVLCDNVDGFIVENGILKQQKPKFRVGGFCAVMLIGFFICIIPLLVFEEIFVAAICFAISIVAGVLFGFFIGGNLSTEEYVEIYPGLNGKGSRVLFYVYNSNGERQWSSITLEDIKKELKAQ